MNFNGVLLFDKPYLKYLECIKDIAPETTIVVGHGQMSFEFNSREHIKAKVNVCMHNMAVNDNYHASFESEFLFKILKSCASQKQIHMSGDGVYLYIRSSIKDYKLRPIKKVFDQIHMGSIVPQCVVYSDMFGKTIKEYKSMEYEAMHIAFEKDFMSLFSESRMYSSKTLIECNGRLPKPTCIPIKQLGRMIKIIALFDFTMISQEKDGTAFMFELDEKCQILFRLF